jgi:hypothetical protein
MNQTFPCSWVILNGLDSYSGMINNTPNNAHYVERNQVLCGIKFHRSHGCTILRYLTFYVSLEGLK